MMSTNNENYVNDVNGATFTSRTSSGRGAPWDSQVVTQRNPYGVRVLGEGLVPKISDNLHQPALVAAPPMCPLHVWRSEWRQHRVFVLEIMSQTHGSTTDIKQDDTQHFFPLFFLFVSLLCGFLLCLRRRLSADSDFIVQPLPCSTYNRW